MKGNRMMLDAGMAAGITLIHIIGAYLRYLPFEAKLLPGERVRLWKYILLWAPISFAMDFGYFLYEGIDIATYKMVHYLGWVPFFAFSLVVIRNEGMRHTFVMGMQVLWFMLLQTVSGTLILTMLPAEFGTGVNRIACQTALYIFFFVAALPLERRLFRDLLPPKLFTGNRLAGWCFAILPLGFCASPLLSLIEKPLMYSWTDRIVRFFLLFWGFTIYRYALFMGQRMERMQREQHTNELLTQQLHALEDHASLLSARAEDVRRARHDLRHYNRLLATLIDAGAVGDARKLIEAQDRGLFAPPLTVYSESSIINAALTVYVQQAKKDGIPISCKVRLDDPGRPADGDNDLAILLSNVIENAVIASRKQPEDRRGIHLALSYHAPQYVLSLENRCDRRLDLGDDGLPVTSERGHGTGMVSLRKFAEKYSADVDFEQEDGVVRLMMYWVGEKAPPPQKIA